MSNEQSEDTNEHGVYVYVASYGEYDVDPPQRSLAFATSEAARGFVTESHTVLGNTEWEETRRGWYCEDQIGNWGLVERVRVSNPEELLRHGN